MKARKIISNAIYDPSELKAVGKAFDDAWAQISAEVSSRAEAVEAARLKLAEIVLSLTRNGVGDADKLTEAAVRALLAARKEIR